MVIATESEYTEERHTSITHKRGWTKSVSYYNYYYCCYYYYYYYYLHYSSYYYYYHPLS